MQMQTLTTTSLIAAFVAGLAALFAPCCVSVLLPSYLANVFKERYKIYFMTFIFFLGILTVFLPIGLGATALVTAFSRYHGQIFSVGGLFLVALGISMLFGKGFATPTFVRDRFKKRATSIYLLGVFSAIATTCCAPVLAGVIALSAVSGKLVWGTLYTLAYVIGMVLPLFIVSVFLDRVDLAKRLTNVKKTVKMGLFGRSWVITISELVSGLVFLGMGGYIIYLAWSNQLAMQSEYQLQMNLFLAGLQSKASGLASAVPESVWAIIVAAIFAWLVYSFIKQSKNHGQE